MEFEDVIDKLGGYGRFQRLLVWAYLAPASLLMPGYFMNQIFMLSVPKHSCVLPDLALTFNLTDTPEPGVLRKFLVTDDDCSTYALDSINESLARGLLWAASASDAGANVTRLLEHHGVEKMACTEFAYDDTNYESTASTQWDLVCDRAHLPSLVFTLGSVGSAIGTVLLGTLSDRIGRKPVFLLTVFIATAFGLSSILVTNFIAFAMLRFMNASVMPQIFQLPYIILLELVGPQQRTLMLGVCCISWTVGLCILPLIAYLSRSWILLGIICSSCAIPNLFYYKLIPESPRWLLSQNKIKDTMAILQRIAKTNGVEVPADLETDLTKVQTKIAEEKEIAAARTFDLFRKARIRRNILIITVSWVANGCAYYGLHINVTNMSGNEFLNFFLLGLVELPASVVGWWTMEYFGRRWSNVALQLLVSVACIASCFIPTEAVVAGVTASLVAKFACAASFMIMYQQAAEVMPTPLRAFALGASSAFSSAFSICMPYIIYLGRYGNWIPFLFLGVLAAAAGISAAWLPETNGYALCQTIEDADEFGKGQQFFSLNRLKDKKKDYDKAGHKEKEMEPMTKSSDVKV
ncbi:organic cation transporter protein-like [Dermacentor albipictus]|uniref:organic cation transporter protein-like n=1 Tax=Dermacentor albipictus TaxID=60249 RepID=UPI0038FCF30B